MDGVHEHHEELVTGFYEQLQQIFTESEQGIYAYLDDEHKVCNTKFAQMLGYSTAQEWAGVKENFPDTFVDDESQEALINAYRMAVDNFAATKLEVIWKKRDGKRVSSQVILVPVAFEDHIFGLHFVTTS